MPDTPAPPLGERLQEIEAREKAATPGDWFTELDGIYDAGRTYMVTPTGDSDQDRADAEFIAAAKRDIPFLLSTVRALRAEPTEAGVVDTHTDLPSASPGGQHVQSKPTCSCGWQEASRAQLWKHQAEALRVELAGVVAGSGIFQRAAEIATEQRDAAESEAAALRAERDGLREALSEAEKKRDYWNEQALGFMRLAMEADGRYYVEWHKSHSVPESECPYCAAALHDEGTPDAP